MSLAKIEWSTFISGDPSDPGDGGPDIEAVCQNADTHRHHCPTHHRDCARRPPVARAQLWRLETAVVVVVDVRDGHAVGGGWRGI